MLSWYGDVARDLPWRGIGRTPYRVMVSEFMLQQTQVMTVVPYFERFVDALPDFNALASADEAQVLRLWQGLGYYSRARRLQAAARVVVDEHDGKLPRDVESLLTLPGVGRYTAGAIASIAFGLAAPIVDGNVSRVIVRLDAIRDDPATPAVLRQLWDRAAEMVDPERPGDFNSAMMELGATVCVPQNPRCLLCPVSHLCQAKAAGIEHQIPPVKRRKPVPTEQRIVWRVTDKKGRRLVEQRPTSGRWAGLWQFPTRLQNEPPPVQATWHDLGRVTHRLTHRLYEFDIQDAVDCRRRRPAGDGLEDGR